MYPHYPLVAVNDGVKHSGLGKEGPKYAGREMTEENMVVVHLA
jgi:hypothetical protein